jgi:hypothetical protein
VYIYYYSGVDTFYLCYVEGVKGVLTHGTAK